MAERIWSHRAFALFVIGVALTLHGCGAATYNEGDNDDQPATNPCAETQATRPVNCEDNDT